MSKRLGNCKICGRRTYLSARGKCKRCSQERWKSAVRDLRRKKGFYYDKWRTGLGHILEEGK